MEMYRASTTFGKIEEVRVSRQTESSVWVINERTGKETRQSKKSGYYNYFDTHDQAKKFLWDNIEKQIFRNQDNLKKLLQRQEVILNLKP